MRISLTRAEWVGMSQVSLSVARWLDRLIADRISQNTWCGWVIAKKLTTIGRAQPEDFDSIGDGVIDLLRQLIGGPHYAGHVFEEGRVRRLIRVDSPRPHQALVVATLKQDVVGLFIGEVQPNPFDDGRLGREIAFIVREDSRSCGIGTKLIEAFRYWVIGEQGATPIQFVHTSGISPFAADHVYSKMGAAKVVSVWKMNIKGNSNAACAIAQPRHRCG